MGWGTGASASAYQQKYKDKKESTMAGWYELTKNENSQYAFTLKAGNAETILTSQRYTQKASAINGIQSVQKNSGNETRFDKKEAKDGRVYFNLLAANGQIIGTSQMYKTEQSRNTGIASVMKNGPTENIKDKTEAS